ncbi:MAG: type 11 methyltransferase [Solirubrobacterales bacterium]|nr:type 11 methyltransferase [Solirubrobacterales bacterium]
MPESRNEYCIRMIPSGTSSVLDIGCGEGAVLGGLPTVEKRVGVDMDAELIANAERFVTGCTFLVVDGGALPFADSSFEAVVLSEVLEHVGNGNKVRVVDEALRVLRPGGRLIITSPHRGPLSRLDPLDFKRSTPRAYGLYRKWREGAPKTAPDVGHVPLTVSEIEALLQGRCKVVDLTLSGLLSPVMAWVMVALMFAKRSEALRFRWARIQDAEQSLPAPRFAAHVVRMTAVLSG